MVSTHLNGPAVGVQDLVSVRSRVSWGAIFAGAVVALSLHLVLTLLGTAVGLSVSDNVRPESLGAGAAVWAIFVTALALFAGGWVTTQCAVGETKMEAVIHGVILWGAVLAMILWLVATGVRTGFNAMLGIAYAGANASRDVSSDDLQATARRAGVPQETIDDWKRKADAAPAEAKSAAENPANRQIAADTATKATWYTLLGTVLSMLTAVAGALLGSGPTFRVFPTAVVQGRVTEIPPQTASRM